MTLGKYKDTHNEGQFIYALYVYLGEEGAANSKQKEKSLRMPLYDSKQCDNPEEDAKYII